MWQGACHGIGIGVLSEAKSAVIGRLKCEDMWYNVLTRLQMDAEDTFYFLVLSSKLLTLCDWLGLMCISNYFPPLLVFLSLPYFRIFYLFPFFVFLFFPHQCGFVR